MQAAVLEQINAPLTVTDEVIPGDPAFGQVLIKVLVSGICGAQLQEIAGHKGNARFVPHLMGHEGCGRVEAIGPGVTRVKPGDKVVMHWRKGEGIESDFPVYQFRGHAMRSGKVTTFSEVSLVSENRLTPVPHELPDDFCALLGCGLSTALSVVAKDARLQPGESVMVIGLGGVGACILKAARLFHASPLIGVDVAENKKEMLALLGGDLFLHAGHDHFSERLAVLGLRSGVDVILDTSGNAEAIARSLPLLAPDGRFIMIGQPKPGETVSLLDAHHLFNGETGKTLRATQGGLFMPSRDIPRFVRLFQSGRLDIHHLITRRIRLAEINHAIAAMRQGKENRIVIDF